MKLSTTNVVGINFKNLIKITEPSRGKIIQKRNKKNLRIEKNYPEKDKKETLSGGFTNIKRGDVWVQRDLMLEYFKKNC